MSQQAFNADLCDFIARSPTPFHAVANMVARLTDAGFAPLPDEGDALSSGGKYFLTRNDSSLVAFVLGDDSDAVDGMRMVGAHTDSPCLMVKPNPEKVRKGYLQLGVEVYGGVLLNPWFDRDLSLAGRVSYRSGEGKLCTGLVDYRAPVAVIPSLAIHLDREANKMRAINPQTDILPILSQPAEGDSGDFRDYLKERLEFEHPGTTVDRVLDYEMAFYDSQAPAPVGLQQQFIASARLDNLLSCFTGLQSLLATDGACSSLLVCNDHEEVGSASAVGAQGPLLQSVLRRIAGDESTYTRLVQRSMMISADNAHGVHPNYADKHDDNHGPLLNAGPVIKINANQRYATNSETAGLVRLLAEDAGVPLQSFVVRTDMACGSTIGPITATEIGVRTMDIGVPTFAMHSIRELAGSDDAWHLHQLLKGFFDYRGQLAAH